MPIFEYRCDACDERFEKLVRSSATREAITCPRCGQTDVRRQFSAFASIGSRRPSADASCAPSG